MPLAGIPDSKSAYDEQAAEGALMAAASLPGLPWLRNIYVLLFTR